MALETKLKDSNNDNIVYVCSHTDVTRKTSQKVHYIPVHKFEEEFLVVCRSDGYTYEMQICCGFPEDKIEQLTCANKLQIPEILY